MVFSMGLLDTPELTAERERTGMTKSQQFERFRVKDEPVTHQRPSSKTKGNLTKLMLSTQEDEVINKVAKEYGLDEVGTDLLFSIREVENGRQGREFGVLRPEAMRFEKSEDPMKSFEIQAKWAAGTIRDRFTGDLKAFADRWAPIGAANDPDNLNANWLPNILDKMKKRGE